MSIRTLFALALAAGAIACSDDGGGGDTTPDTTAETVSDAATDTTADSTSGTTAPDTTTDTSAPDTSGDTTALDTTADTSAPDGDTSQSDLTIAVPGARCALDERVGLIEISAPVFGPNGYASGWVQDEPDPWYGDFELTTEQCGFHLQSKVACPPCGGDELCDRSGQCTKAPVRRTDVELVLAAGETTQTFTADGTTGDLYGDITLTGDTLSVALAFAGHTVTLAPTTFPAQLADAAGTMTGDYDAPTAVDITWTPIVDGGQVYTLIPINHHAAGPTFTECSVPASAGALHVGEAMLTPLAVITGLEFQGVHHLRFAAAETPLGCVEIRFTGGQQYVSLEPAR
ncbi:MAG: hypothetical protein IT385_16650 [Deltaproteobacteria bacterium]|nr:hypothetical protein [Deltaproteobacteria bacterium]